MRLFVAIDLSHSLREKLSDQIQQLKRSLGSNDIRWINPSGIHLTLKFLGETPEDQLDDLYRLLSKVASQYSPFTMKAGSFGCFPNHRKPRAVWIGVQEASGELVRLRDGLELAMRELGFEQDNRPFTAHLTLGRIRKHVLPADLQALSRQLEKIQIGNLDTQVVKDICLFSSLLRPDGSVYTRLRVFPLGKSE